MPGPTVGNAAPSALAQACRRFGEGDVAGTSPLYQRVAVALSESAEAPRAIETAPARKRHHAVLYPAIAEAAHRVGAKAIGLIDVGRSTGLNLDVDRMGNPLRARVR